MLYTTIIRINLSNLWIKWFSVNLYITRPSIVLTCVIRDIIKKIPVGSRFSVRPVRNWGPPSLLYIGYRVFPGDKVRLRRAADHSPPFTATVVEELSFTSATLWATPPCNGITHIYITFFHFFSYYCSVYWSTISEYEPVVMISIDDKAFQSVTFQINTLIYNFISCFSSYVYNFVTVTVYNCLGAVKCPSFSEFPYSTSGITLVYEEAKWKEGSVLLWYTADRGISTKSREIW